MTDSSLTWHLVEAKLKELRRLTDRQWANEEWELAALGERTIKTVQASRQASDELRENYTRFRETTAQLKTVTDDYRRRFEANSEA